MPITPCFDPDTGASGGPASSGGGGGGGGGGDVGWVTKLSLDLTGASSSGPHTTGTTTVDATGGNIDMTADRTGNSGNVTITAGTGAVVTAVGGSGAMSGFFDLKAALTGYDIEYIRFYPIVVDVTVTAINFDDDGSIANISLTDSKTAWNDGDARAWELYRANATDETRRVRGAGGTTVIGTQRTQVQQRVISLVMTSGQVVTLADTDGSTAPVNPHTASPLYVAGGDAIGRTGDPLYLANLFVGVTAFGGASITVSKIVVRRQEAS